MRRPSPLISLILLIVVCVVLVAWYKAARRGDDKNDRMYGGMSPPEQGTLFVLRWVQRPLMAVGNWFGDVGRTMTRRNGIISENEALRKRLADLEGQNQRLTRYRLENAELRQLLKMPKLPGGKEVAADIVSLDATDYARRVILNAGSRRGVRPKDVVYTAHGVVGHVITVSPFSCVVLLLTDRKSGAGAMTSRTMAKGVVKGTGDPICKMEYVDFHADVREGDLVVTSGDSTIFPRGLVIGRVLKVEKNKTYSSMNAYIDPAVPFDQISAVWVRVQAGS